MGLLDNVFRRGTREERRARRRQKKFDAELTAELDAEQAATRAGIAQFNAAAETQARSYALLRRNVHRIEKGLCMPGPRKPVFAEKYITETVAVYARLVSNPEAEREELKWAHDVLAAYFAVVDASGPIVGDARRVWDALAQPQFAETAPSYTPYDRAHLPEFVGDALDHLPDLDAFYRLCRARRSQRWFQPKPVPMDVVERAVACAAMAPSACNRQPYRFVAATSREMVKAITDLPLGTAGFGADLPMVVAVVGNLSMYAHPRDRHLIFVDSGLASMAFMTGLTAGGLGSVPINWPDIPENHAALRDLLELAAFEVPVMLIGIGVPLDSARIPYSAKRPVHEVLHVVD